MVDLAAHPLPNASVQPHERGHAAPTGYQNFECRVRVGCNA